MGALLDAIREHGIGGRQDLPIPFAFAVTGAAVVLVLSFVLLAVLWRDPRLGRDVAGRALPQRLAAALDAAPTRWLFRLVGLAVTGYVLLAALFGPDDALNPTAGAVYVLFWVGTVAFASALLGPVWRLVNPLRTVHLLACRALRRDPLRAAAPYPVVLGRWPAAGALLAFGWLELVAPDRATLPVLRTWFGLYVVVMLVGAAVFGSGWFDRADGFEVASSTLGRLSVLGRRRDGVLVLRSPLDGLAAMRPGPGDAAVVGVLLGTTAYDGLSNATGWVRLVQEGALSPLATQTLGLLAAVGLVTGLYAVAVAAAGRLGGASRRELPAQFAHSVAPIALGYLVAHYWTLFAITGQQTLMQLSDPLGRGSDWLGLADRGISYAGITPTSVSTVQVSAVVLGHVLGVVLAHDRAVRLFPRRQALLGQLPLLALMVTYTVGGLLLLFAA